MSKFQPPSPPMIAARWHGGPQIPHAIVMHATVSPCQKGGARAVARFFASETNKTSAHYVVDPGEVVQCVGDHTIAYHCGYNTGSIGVELCDPQTGPGSRWNDRPHKAMLARAATLVAQLCMAYEIAPDHVSVRSLKADGPHGIYSHNQSRLAFGNTTHVDPGPDFPWHGFIAAVHAEIDRLAKPVAPKPKPKPTRGANVDAAIAAVAKAERANPTSKRPGKHHKLSRALAWLRKIGLHR